jgi:hypothetical protein
LASLQSVRHKIHRAKQHFDALGAEYKRFVETNPGKMVELPETDAGNVTIGIVFDPVPIHFTMIFGDCLQNLRSSLDYLVRELVLAANNQPNDHEMFPICGKPKSFKSAIERGQIEGVPTDAVTEIESLQPYRLGPDWEKDILWVVDNLTNVNKHRRVLLAAMKAVETKVDITTKDGKVWAHTTIPMLDHDATVGPFKEEMNIQHQIAAYIILNEGAAKNLEIGTLVKGMFSYIEDVVVAKFERFF